MMEAFFQRLLDSSAGFTGNEGRGDLRSVTVDLGDGTQVEVADEGDEVLGLYAKVAEFEEEPPEAFWKDIAIANFGCAGTSGATLGYDPETRTVLLVRYWPIGGMETAAAFALVELFVETVYTWRDRVERLEAGSLLPEDSAPIPHDRDLPHFA